MYYQNNRQRFTRLNVRVNFGLTPPSRGVKIPNNYNFETPGAMPTGDGTPLNVEVFPDGTQSPISAGKPTRKEQPQRQRNPKATSTNPRTAKKTDLQTEPKMYKSTSKKRGVTVRDKTSNKDQKVYMNVFKGGKPKIEVSFTSQDNVPQGQVFYDGGERVYTDSRAQGKLSPIRTIKQVPDDSNGGSTSLGQVRCQIQIVKPHFLGQFGILEPDLASVNDSKLDDTHTLVYRHMHKQMRNIYQQVKNINNTFNADFTLGNTYTYFYDGFALFCELVCLLQGAAYHLNDLTGCDNVVLSAIGNTLNKTSFHDMRNEMARTLRFSYLPDFCVDEAYELFQTYRVGQGTTSGSLRYVTPIMGELLINLGNSTTETEVAAAIANYKVGIDHRIKMVKNGRANSEVVGSSNYDPPARRWYNLDPSTADPSASNINSYEVNVFPSGQGALSSDTRQSIDSFLYEISKHCKISMLNNIRRGNSQSLHSDEWNDMWNNQQYVRLASGDSDYAWPIRIVGGGTENDQKGPDWTESTIYCSETPANDISFKQVQFMIGRFTGYSPLLWNIFQNNDVTSSRYRLHETTSKGALGTEDDILCDVVDDITNFVTGQEKAFTQNNYVTKVFREGDGTAGTGYHSFSNPDGQSEGQWYLTLGSLRENQFDEGIDKL
jgi:hypothetical protein